MELQEYKIIGPFSYSSHNLISIYICITSEQSSIQKLLSHLNSGRTTKQNNNTYSIPNWSTKASSTLLCLRYQITPPSHWKCQIYQIASGEVTHVCHKTFSQWQHWCLWKTMEPLIKSVAMRWAHCPPGRYKRIMHELPWITIFGSRVRRFANNFHEWRSHVWKSLANRITSDPKIVIHIASRVTQKSLFTVTNVILYFLHAILCPEHNSAKKIVDRWFEEWFRHCG